MKKFDHLTYRRTDTGEVALHGMDTAIPADYRRILSLIDEDMHINVIRGRLRRYSDALIADWLGELEELGFIESSRAGEASDPNFESLVNNAPSVRALSELPDEQRRIEEEAKSADVALKGKGAYLATARLQNREPLSKDPAQCVVLLVEDDPDQVALGDLRVSMAGYGVRIARSRRELIKDLITHPAPDLILLDVILPDDNGFKILAGLRLHPTFSLLPVIMLTAMTGAEDIRRGLDLGADGYVTKPYSKNLLIDTIRQVLRHR
jgi:CheY-like chemotaxis protein